MPKLCVFAGTTEGREIAEFLAEQSADVTVCVATEYGETLLPQGEGVHISARPLPREEMAELFRRERFDLVIDATHPYAKRITESIAATCAGTDTEYLRLLRPDTAAPENAVFVEDAAGAAEYLDRVDGNILLTTGSRELHAFASVRDFASRAYARVLPMEDSLRACREAGLPPAHILAMQGPFSRELNAAMLRSIGAAYLVTKASGSAGGFEEKIAAAAETGAVPVIIGRPPQREGLSAAETVELLCRRFGFSAKPEVAVVGLGPGSRTALTGEAREALSRAGTGGARRHRAGGYPRLHSRAPGIPLVRGRYVRRHRLFQRHEEAPAAARRLPCHGAAGAELALLPLREAWHVLRGCAPRYAPRPERANFAPARAGAAGLRARRRRKRHGKALPRAYGKRHGRGACFGRRASELPRRGHHHRHGGGAFGKTV